MPIYEYYCPDNHTIYQFYAKTLAQGRTVPPCPDNPEYRLVKLVSSFAVGRGGRTDESAEQAGEPGLEAGEDARVDAAMEAMEREFSAVDENDPRAMGRMMRRMAELTGEKIEGEMEEVVRKLEEGVDPDTLEEALGGQAEGGADDPYGESSAPQEAGAEPKEVRARFKVRRRAPTRDPRLYDYP